MSANEFIAFPECRLANPPQVFQDWNAVDLCSGLGGLSIGARMLGMNTVGFMDSWKLATETVQANFPDACSVTGSITLKRDRDRLKKDLGDVDVVLAGPPCQGFTQVQNGRHQPRDPRIAVMHGVKKACADFEPKVLIIENVPAISLHQGGAFAQRLREYLSKLGPGYDVSFGVVSAASYGVPQQRRRAFFIGVRSGVGSFEFPAVQDFTGYLSARRRKSRLNGFSSFAGEVLANPEDDRLVSVRQAIGDLPRVPAGSSQESGPYIGQANAYQKRMRGESDTVTRIQTPRMRDRTAKVLRQIEPGQCLQNLSANVRKEFKRRHYSAYRRLHPELPSTTLFTKIDCAYHYDVERALSVREYARIQSIPDNYELPPVARHAYAMIGNAVPPLLIARMLAAGLSIN